MLRMRTSEKRMCVVITVQKRRACAHQKKECALLLRCKNVAHAHIRKLSLFCFWEHFICFEREVSYLQVRNVLCKTEMESVSFHKLEMSCVKQKSRAFFCLRRFFVISFSFFRVLLDGGYVFLVYVTFFLLGSPLEKFASLIFFLSGTAKECFSFV